jgi:hypothetical protein
MSFGGGSGGGGSLATDSDVSLSNPATQDFLSYDSGTGKWGNVPLVGTAALATGGGKETISSGSVGAGAVIDLSLGNVFRLRLVGDADFTFTGGTTSSTIASAFTVYLRQNATYGPYSATWPANVLWPGGVAPTVTQTPNALDILVFETTDGGSTWCGALVGSDYK